MTDEQIAAMPASELVNAVGLSMYEPPLVDTILEHKRQVSELGVVALFIDVDTELQMGRLPTFLENSNGLYLDQTITAFVRIGANETAAILTTARSIMGEHGVTVERLRQDVATAEEYAITSFSQTHGAETDEMVGRIVEVAKELYIYGNAAEEPYSLLEEFVAINDVAVRDQLAAAFL